MVGATSISIHPNPNSSSLSNLHPHHQSKLHPHHQSNISLSLTAKEERKKLAHCRQSMASCFQPPNVIDDTTVLFSSSTDSPELECYSVSPPSSSSTFQLYRSPPQPVAHQYSSKTSAAYTLSVRNLSYTIHQSRWSWNNNHNKPNSPTVNILKSVSFRSKKLRNPCCCRPKWHWEIHSATDNFWAG